MANVDNTYLNTKVASECGSAKSEVEVRVPVVQNIKVIGKGEELLLFEKQNVMEPAGVCAKSTPPLCGGSGKARAKGGAIPANAALGSAPKKHRTQV